MSEANTQTAVDAADGQAKPGAEATASARAPDDFNKALDEFDAAVKPSPTPEQKPAAAAQAPAGADVLKRVETLERELSDRNYKDQIQPVIAKVRGDVPTDVFSDDELDAWLNHRAKSDPRLRSAWLGRHQNPQAWDRVTEGLKQEFGKKFAPRVDAQATADREAVTAAVRGATHKAPEGKPPDYSSDSNPEFRAKVKKEFGFTPPV